jgi:hypothetical protein
MITMSIRMRVIAATLVLVVLSLVLVSWRQRSEKKALQLKKQAQAAEEQRERRQREERQGEQAAQQEAARRAKAAKIKALEKEQQAWNSTHPDPPPPVTPEKISGEWWYEQHRPFKAYLFVESMPGPTLEASLPDGRTMSIVCDVRESVDSSYVKVPPEYCPGLAGESHSWVRVTMGSILKYGASAPVEGWALMWHDGDMLEAWRVVEFCDPQCMSFHDKFQQFLREQTERQRRGED